VGTKLTSFRNKFIGLALLVALGSQISTVTAVLFAASEDANQRAYTQMESGSEIYRGIIANRAKVLDQTVRPLAANPDFIASITAGNTPKIEADLIKRINWVEADIGILLSLDGSVIASAGNLSVIDETLVTLTRDQRSSITLNNSTYEMVMVPVETSETIAWIGMGFLIDDTLAKELSSVTGMELSFFTGMDSGKISFLGSSLPKSDRDLIINASLAIKSGAEMYKAIEPLKQQYISNREYFFDEGDEIFVVVQIPLVEAMAAYETMRGSMLHAASTSLLLALVAAYILSRTVTQPVRRLLIAAKRFKVGNYSQPVVANSRDELGELANAFEAMRKGIAEREQRIYYQAQFDQLTDLPNRSQGIELLRDVMRTANKQNQQAAVIVMHLQRFREIQSSLGHEIGDEVLRQTALRLKGILDDGQVLARLEGDQFLLISPNTDRRAAKKLALKLADSLDSGLSVHDVNVSLDACIGLCIYPEHGRQPDQLLRRAAVAKNDTQNSHNRIRVYQNGREARHVRQLAILGDMRRATQENELQLFLQPKITLETTAVCGAEALLRWEHPELGNIPPDEFIPLAESAGSISMITKWVLDRAIQQCSEWKAQGISLPIAVNLSSRDLMDSKLPDYIKQTLQKHAVSSGSLILEITEEAVVHDFEQATKVLNELKVMGCMTSMDDFGTGYSSLTHLQKLPVDELKIDRAFVTQIPDCPQNTAIVRSVIELAHNLGLEVVAEGVETTAALRWLREEGCERAQGYYLSKPMPADQFCSWLRSWEHLAQEDAQHADPTDSLILRPRLIT
jgi:diguanylate cyclase (GGDEF)-like protein